MALGLQVKAFLDPPTEGAILETYGAGNGPDARKDLLQVISDAAARGVVIINCTQCMYGHVEEAYATGRVSLLYLWGQRKWNGSGKRWRGVGWGEGGDS